MSGHMHTQTVEQALRRLGELIDYHMEIEILLVGGAAGMLTGVLPPERTTTDCDVMDYAPDHALAVVERAADQVGTELELPEGWLNSTVQIRVDTLPEGWKQRRHFIGQHRMLRVYAADRLDLIAMKVLAGRDQDIDDLNVLRVRHDEAPFVRDYLDCLAARGTDPEQIELAHALLESMELHDGE